MFGVRSALWHIWTIAGLAIAAAAVTAGCGTKRRAVEGAIAASLAGVALREVGRSFAPLRAALSRRSARSSTPGGR
jgi:hypothetical protein